RRRHTRFSRDWSSDVCSSDLKLLDTIISSRKPDRMVTIAVSGIQMNTLRRWNPAITGPAAGPVWATAGITKKVEKLIPPTQMIAPITCSNRSTSSSPAIVSPWNMGIDGLYLDPDRNKVTVTHTTGNKITAPTGRGPPLAPAGRRTLGCPDS